ncbi:outer membrane beta-barrel protein [Croceibacterium sp. TMG7-5b_MA50]|uniref:outer membrane protein n=1 Tax=Croceibacterium sp. TMG7-5b_MA50 TaxID=3121290 RepID=UPI0032222005
MHKGLALLAAGSVIALSAPAMAQENPTFTGPRVEALVGYDINKPGSSQDIDNADDLDQSFEGASYGVGIGYDFAAGGALIGVEGEYMGSSAETDYDTGAFETFGVSNVEAGDDLYLGLRAGILASPRALVYVKGGYTNASYNVLTSNGTANTDTDIDLDGWRVGAGAEYALSNNLFVKGEYRYSNYEEGEVEGPNGGESDRFDIDMDRHQVMLGLGYRF